MYNKNFLKYIVPSLLVFLLWGGYLLAAPVSNIFRNVLPETNDTYEIGTTTPQSQWLRIFARNASTTNITVYGNLQAGGSATTTLFANGNVTIGNNLTITGTCTGCGGISSLNGLTGTTQTFSTTNPSLNYTNLTITSSGTEHSFLISATSSPTYGFFNASSTSATSTIIYGLDVGNTLRATAIIGTSTAQLNSANIGTSTIGQLNAGSIVATSTLEVRGNTTFNGVTYTWPTAQGAADDVLTNNGTGVLSWGAGGGGGAATFNMVAGTALNAGDFGAVATTTYAATSTNQSLGANESTCGDNGTVQMCAQEVQFRFGTGMLIDSATLRLKKTGSPSGNVVVELRVATTTSTEVATNGSTTISIAPSGGITAPGSVIASSTIQNEDVTTTEADISVSFFPRVLVAPNERIYLVLRPTQQNSATDNWDWRRHGASNTYDFGERYEFNGTSWAINLANDHRFTLTGVAVREDNIYYTSGQLVNTASTTVGVVTADAATSSNATIQATGAVSLWRSLLVGRTYYLATSTRERVNLNQGGWLRLGSAISSTTILLNLFNQF